MAKRNVKKVREQRKILKAAGHCSYCNIFCESREVEHVYPDSWYNFGEPQSERLIVSSCGACNDLFAPHEEAARAVLAVMSLKPSDPVYQKVIASFQDEKKLEKLNPKLRNLKEITTSMLGGVPTQLEDLKPFIQIFQDEYDPTKMYSLPVYGTVSYPHESFKLLFEKLVKGSHWFLFKNVLNHNLNIRYAGYQEVGEYWNWAIAPEQSSVRTVVFNTPSFKAVRLGEDHYDSCIWLFQLLGGSYWVASVSDF